MLGIKPSLTTRRFQDMRRVVIWEISVQRMISARQWLEQPSTTSPLACLATSVPSNWLFTVSRMLDCNPSGEVVPADRKNVVVRQPLERTDDRRVIRSSVADNCRAYPPRKVTRSNRVTGLDPGINFRCWRRPLKAFSPQSGGFLNLSYRRLSMRCTCNVCVSFSELPCCLLEGNLLLFEFECAYPLCQSDGSHFVGDEDASGIGLRF
jgi:hypothetical protein